MRITFVLINGFKCCTSCILLSGRQIHARNIYVDRIHFFYYSLQNRKLSIAFQINELCRQRFHTLIGQYICDGSLFYGVKRLYKFDLNKMLLFISCLSYSYLRKRRFNYRDYRISCISFLPLDIHKIISL